MLKCCPHQIGWLDYRAYRFELLLLLVCVLEVFIIQHLTLYASHRITVIHKLLSPAIRIALDVAFFAFLIALFGKTILRVILVIQFFFLASLLTYYSYFSHPLSINTVIHQGGEGMLVLDFAWELINPWVIVGLLGVLGVKWYLAGGLRISTRLKRHSAVPLMAYLLLATFSAIWVDPLKNLSTHAYMGSTGMTYGYGITWLGQLLYQHDDALLERAVEKGKTGGDATRVRRLLDEEPIMHDNVVVIQIESLDYDLIDYRVGHREVVPYLSDFFRKSTSIKTHAVHRNGSADADFVNLMNRHPSEDVITYKLIGYPFELSPLRSLTDGMYEATFYHGASGIFFGRRAAYEKMGFSSIWFKEEILKSGVSAMQDAWGIKDCDLFNFAASRLPRGSPSYSFLITVTSHGPFIFLDPEDKQLFPRSGNIREDYLNSMHYVDRCFGIFLAALPADTTVVVYGDHSAGVAFREGNNGRTELVPYMIGSTTPGVISPQQIKTNGISILDTTAYVWSRLLKQTPTANQNQ